METCFRLQIAWVKGRGVMASSKKRKDKRIETEYWEEIEVTDPKTGKKFKQKVKVVRYKAVPAHKPVGNKGIVEELYDSDYDDLTDEES